MSVHSIRQYLTEVERIKRFGGTSKETAIRTAFQYLLNEYARGKNLMLITELSLKGAKGNTVTPDGTLKDSLQLDWGHWESKDENDDLDTEIVKKFEKGYPKDNILFEDSITAVLIQGGHEVQRTPMKDEANLDRLLKAFVEYQRPEVRDFREAIERFKADVPSVTETIRGNIIAQEKSNPKFQQARNDFWELCKVSINPEISSEDLREMMIQHILTEDIFNTIFDETQFHRENNIARELDNVIRTFFTGAARRVTLESLKHYYNVINARAAQIQDHHEKQMFLKVIYETFYKAYNPKAADKLGIIYTPNEVVKFMIESTDYLLDKHFNRALEDKGVEILDPATGTGTFICDIIDYIRPEKLEHKYKNEIHANEVAILPYYIANLNVEFTYKQKTGQYLEFENLCFVDTLDNVGFGFRGKQQDLFGVSAENSDRIKRQNEKEISVVIGNPPYNAKQENYNYQNANRAYQKIDKRIKDTYIKHGTAQNQIVLYDMYVRFFRWAADRLAKNGIIAFVTNSSFIDSRSFDGFRKCAQNEFNHIYIINLKGNARISGEQRRKEGGNVFSDEIRVGVSVYFFIKKEGETGCQIHYNEVPDYVGAEVKKAYLSENKLQNISFERIRPDAKHNWLNISDNDFETLLPMIDKDVKSGKGEGAIFKMFSYGFDTKRDEWIFDIDKKRLEDKIIFFNEIYNSFVRDNAFGEKMLIKWSRNLERDAERKKVALYSTTNIFKTLYRPFVEKHTYWGKLHISETFQWFNLPLDKNKFIAFSGVGLNKPFQALVSAAPICGDFLEKTQCVPLYSSSNTENITDWGLSQFTEHYQDQTITKESIFEYVYGVLHNPAYRAKYEVNLKREFPRIPFYSDFWQWSAWGKQLMDLHINFEQVQPYPLTEHHIEKENPKPMLKADREQGLIYLDTQTYLSGIPPEAWEYKLGNRAALDWILDQYKESTPKDPTIREKFNTYRFSDHKDQVLDLLKKVCRVSVETVGIVNAMKGSGEG